MSHKIREADIRRKKRTKAISDFLRRVIPNRAPPNFNRELPSSSSHKPELSETQLKVEAKTPRIPSQIPSNSLEIVYDDVTEGGQTEKDAIPPRSRKRFLDTQYGIRSDGE